MSQDISKSRNPFSDQQFAELAEEWHLIVTPPADIAELKAAFEIAAAEYAEIRIRGAWVSGRADFFGVLGLGRAELTHSSMLAWLLDPEGRHGFGRRFLDLLVMRHLPGLDPKTFRVIDVQTEVQRLETRADIVVWGDTATIIIEVKVDAGEGSKQCDRLYQRFIDNPDPAFIFLTPSGRKPLTATGDAAKAFQTMSFVDIREILEETLEQRSEGDGVSAAVDYVRTLREEFD